MAYGTPNGPHSHRYELEVRHPAITDFSLNFRIDIAQGDVPLAEADVMVQRLVDLITSSANFQLLTAIRTHKYDQTITPS